MVEIICPCHKYNCFTSPMTNICETLLQSYFRLHFFSKEFNKVLDYTVLKANIWHGKVPSIRFSFHMVNSVTCMNIGTSLEKAINSAYQIIRRSLSEDNTKLLSHP